MMIRVGDNIINLSQVRSVKIDVTGGIFITFVNGIVTPFDFSIDAFWNAVKEVQ